MRRARTFRDYSFERDAAGMPTKLFWRGDYREVKKWSVRWINPRGDLRTRYFDDFNTALNFSVRFPSCRVALGECLIWEPARKVSVARSDVGV
jgi:hypothetical protein